MTTIVQLTDLHLRPRGTPALRVVETNMFAARAIRAVATLTSRPDAVIVTGDVADTADPRAYELAHELLAALPVPVYLLAGNHDSARTMRSAFADWPGVSEAPSDRVHYAAEIGDLRLVALDTSVEGQPYGSLGNEQLAWLDATLAAAPDRPTLIAMHHPPFTTGIAHMDRTRLTDSDAFAEIVSAHRQVRRIVCGHVHRTVVAPFGGTHAMIVPGVAHQVALDLTATSAAQFVMEPPAYGIHAWTGEDLVSHVAYVEAFPGPYPFSPAEGVFWPGD
ncbi:phosphodiesterase [Amorphus orientalis]|uniref:3',5'-cyclic AMP phosphodiesterase CpdA n=1 Tax=Amorphus orientalis TaxID=649198 RepID=A0AAE3VPC4_9HYPH|nr:phosphodiesterase [Amorphus orientalis]MDQ0316344.1 3',5'-cyclic AMP phosphodiesterase CpdA [Amorphus orientalis]